MYNMILGDFIKKKLGIICTFLIFSFFIALHLSSPVGESSHSFFQFISRVSSSSLQIYIYVSFIVLSVLWVFHIAWLQQIIFLSGSSLPH